MTRKKATKTTRATKGAIATMVALSTVSGVVAPIPSKVDAATPSTDFNILTMRDFVRILDYVGNDKHITIPETIGGLPVTYVMIQNKDITSIDLSQAHADLEQVFLDNNQLETITFGSHTNLRHLSLKNNNLTVLDVTGLYGLESLTTYGNPLNDASRDMLPGLANASVKDNANPTVTIKNNAGGNLGQNAKVPVLVEDNIEVSKIEYAWTTSKDAPTTWERYTEQSLTGSATESILISAPITEGTYYLQVRAYDLKGQISDVAVSAKPFNTVYPQNVQFSQQGNTEYAKEHSVTYKLTMPADKVEYGWSSSRTTPPMTYTEGAQEATVTTPLASGTHYLWVKATTNNKAYTFQSSGFAVDATAPTLNPQTSSVTMEGTKLAVKVDVGVTETGSGVVEMKYASGQQTTDYFKTKGTTILNKQFEVYQNGDYTVYAKDKAGNETVKIFTVSAFDMTKPVITITPNGVSTPAPSHKVEVDAVDDTKLVKLEYAWSQTPELPSASEFVAITPKTIVETPSNGKGNFYLHVKATDDQNNVSILTSAPYVVDSVATDAPTISLVNQAWTNGNVQVKVTAPQGASKVEYRIGETGLWTEYTTPFTVSENGKVYARAYNQAGILSQVSDLAIQNIDKVKPTVSLSINGNPTVAKSHATVIQAADNRAIEKVEYAWSTSKTTLSSDLQYKSTTNGAVVVSPTGAKGDLYLHVRVTDHVGNVSSMVSEVFKVNDQAPNAPSINLDVTKPTKENVKVTIMYPADAVKREYRIGTGGGWQSYSGPITVTDNTTVYARSFNNTDMVSPIGVAAVQNIDRMNPIINLSQAQNETPSQKHETKVTVQDNTQVAKLTYAWSTSDKVEPLKFSTFTNGTTLATPSESGVYYLWVKAEDAATNASTTVSGGFLVATTPPVLNVAYSTTNPTTKNVTLKVTPKDSQLGAKVIKFAKGKQELNYFASNGTDVSKTRQTSVSENGIYTFYVEDLIGNKSVQHIVVSNIDKTNSVVQLSQNGNPIYATAHTTKIYVTDNLGIGEIQYGWSTSKTKEPISFEVIKNGTSVTTPPDGESYYLWVKTKDVAGNTDTFISNVFNTEVADLGEVPTCESSGGNCEAILLTEGTRHIVKATVEGGKDFIKVNSSRLSFELPLEKTAKKWEVTVSYDAKSAYGTVEITVKADGNIVRSFNKPMYVIVKNAPFDFVGRVVGEKLYATPHLHIKNEGMQFHAYTTDSVYKLYTDTKTFNDIKGNFAQKEIEQLANRAIIAGTSATTYSPNDNITRGQFAAILGRSLGQFSTQTSPFTDIKGSIFEEEITLLNELGLVLGVTSNKFGINATITREQAVTIFDRVLDHYGYKGNTAPTHSFKDVHEVSNFAKDSVNRLAGLGVINGMPDGTFQPQGAVTRAQMAKMMWQVLKLIELY